MSNDYSHVHPELRTLVDGLEGDRIRAIRTPRWFSYPRAKEAIDKLEDLINYPRSSRMPNLFIYGMTNNGKTMLIEQFMRRYPAVDNPLAATAQIPLLNIQMPFAPDPRRFYRVILDQLFATYGVSDTTARLETQSLSMLADCGIRMLIIDELHNLLTARIDKQKVFLNLIRYIGNELKVPMIGVGLRSGITALQHDEQLENRFEPFHLPKWEDTDEYHQLLHSFMKLMPLKHDSELAFSDLAYDILALSEGTIGEITTIIRLSAIHAVKSGGEVLDQKAVENCGYIPPRRRKDIVQGGD